MRASALSEVTAGSHVNRASARVTSSSAWIAPGTAIGIRSTSQTHEAQCTPSRYSAISRSPSRRTVTCAAWNASWSNSAKLRPLLVTRSVTRSGSE